VSPPIERVLLALDAAVETRGAIATAARLAARAGVQLHAVFVEDEELLRLADLPVARHVVAGSAAAPFSTEEVELHLRAAAARVQEEVLAAAHGHALECSFEIVRGGAETALAAASERDLVVAAAVARPVAGYFRVQSRWIRVHEQAPGPFLLVCESSVEHGGVVALMRERGPASGRLLRAAALLADLAEASLTVICPPGLAAAHGFARWVEDEVGPAAARPQVESAPSEPAELPRRLAALGCGMVAIGADAAEEGFERLREWIARLGCDVLVVP
jgi:hypothetical protein